ncbi:UNVERIFIED_CONTAM: hypothetical protein Slati_4093000, partial [Sesamum latifolium]
MEYSTSAELLKGGCGGHQPGKERCGGSGIFFQMPLHYPKYTAKDYESMPEWKLDCLLSQYGCRPSARLIRKGSSPWALSFGLATITPLKVLILSISMVILRKSMTEDLHRLFDIW